MRTVFSKNMTLRVSVSPWLAIAFFSVLSAPSVVSAQPRINYQTQVRPLLEDRCLECHSHDKR